MKIKAIDTRVAAYHYIFFPSTIYLCNVLQSAVHLCLLSMVGINTADYTTDVQFLTAFGLVHAVAASTLLRNTCILHGHGFLL